MKYFFGIVILAALALITLAGSRGEISRKTERYIFPDMDRQVKTRPQDPSDFFANGRTSQPLPEGVVARGDNFASHGAPDVFDYMDHPINTGRLTGSTNFVDAIPVDVTEDLITRGQERYGVSCLPCHGPLGDGKGVTSKLGMAVVADLHQERLLKATDGEIFHTISNGKGLMGGYGANVTVEDRWAIVAYVRALQLRLLGQKEDVPANEFANLTE